MNVQTKAPADRRRRGEIADAAEIRERRRGAPPSQGPLSGGRLPPIRTLRIRRGRRRTHHGARPRALPLVLGESLRQRASLPDSCASDLTFVKMSTGK